MNLVGKLNRVDIKLRSEFLRASEINGLSGELLPMFTDATGDNAGVFRTELEASMFGV